LVAKDFFSALQKREVSAQELLEQVIAPVEYRRVNAVVVPDFELLGIPMTVQESFNVRDCRRPGEFRALKILWCGRMR
jgi:hypothetical protein